VVGGICFLVNGRTSAKVLCHWMFIDARNVVDWISTTTTLACLKANDGKPACRSLSTTCSD